jgi:hypothetical protein
MWKTRIVAYYKILSGQSSEVTEEDHENPPKSGYPVSEGRFEPGTPNTKKLKKKVKLSL